MREQGHQRRMKLAVAAAVGAMALGAGAVLAAPDGGSQSRAPTNHGPPYRSADVVHTLPAGIQPWYFKLNQNVGVSALGNFKAKQGPPFTLGYASTYAGNTWRAAVRERLFKVLLPRYKKLGLVDRILLAESNLKTDVQIQNQKQLLDQGADVLFTCCPPPSALDNSIKFAFERGGVFFVSFDGDVTSPFALNTGVNYYLAGLREADWLAKEIGREGNVLLVSGIPGNNASDRFDAGAKEGLKKYPDVKLIGNVAGNWTDPIAKTEVLKFLATHPEPVHGVIAQSAEETGVLQALKQSGREVVPITIGGEIGPFCYWRNHPDWISKGFLIWPPGDEVELAVRVMLRTLLGQGPKIQSITRPQFSVTLAQVRKKVPANCSEDSTGWVQLGGQGWMSDKTLDAFFKRPFPLQDWRKHYRP